MAEKALEKIGEQLNCSICLDTYTDPKLLQCFHIYCQQCLVPLGVRDQQGQLSISCPTCRQVTPIPARGVAGLKSAFHINNLLEIYGDSSKKLENAPATPEEAKPTDLNPAKKASHCSVHEGKELKLYCETCGELICYKCALKGGKHHSHDYVDLNVALEKYKEEIMPLLEPMEKQVTTIEKCLSEIKQCCGEISDQRAAVENKIHANFRQLREVLTVRETQLIGQLHQMTQAKLKGLAAQSDQIETTLAKLNNSLHLIRRTANESDVLMMEVNTVQQAKKLITPFQPDMLKPNTEADIVFSFSALADLTAMCQSYGQVFTPDSPDPSKLRVKPRFHFIGKRDPSKFHVTGQPDPSKCHVTGKGLEMAVVKKKSTAILHAVGYEGTLSAKVIKTELVSEITGTRTSCSVERRGKSQYEISYQPTARGKHQLDIKVEGQHVRGSPFSVAVTIPVEKLGIPILTLHGIRALGVAINQKGEMIVTRESGYISTFDSRKKKLGAFMIDGKCRYPFGVAVDGEGNILVANSDGYCIQRLKTNGDFIETVGGYGNGPLQFSYPAGIAFNTSNNKVYVVDKGNHHVQVLNSDLTFSSTFGKQGSGKGQFTYPRGIACDSTGKVYVADTNNHRIQVFTAEGKFVRVFGRHGRDKGKLNEPHYIAVDMRGMVYVSEFANHRVSVFTLEGQFVTSFGKKGSGPGEFNTPHGLAVDSGVVYVCDSLNWCVKAF